LIDRDIYQGLPTEQRTALDDAQTRYGARRIETEREVGTALHDGFPDLMYWLCHADPTALYLGDDSIGPERLRELLEPRESEDGQAEERRGGLVFLNCCRTGEGSETGSFLETFYHLGLSGLIATEHETIDTFAAPAGLEFLRAFLENGVDVGTALHALRRQVP